MAVLLKKQRRVLHLRHIPRTLREAGDVAARGEPNVLARRAPDVPGGLAGEERAHVVREAAEVEDVEGGEAEHYLVWA